MSIEIQSDVFVIIGLTLLLSIAVILISKKIDKADPLAKPDMMTSAILWLVTSLDSQVKDNVGKRIARSLSPYVVSITIYIFMANILGLFGFSSPTANLSVTLTLTIITWTMTQIAQISNGGIKGYLHSFLEPLALMLPMNIFGKFSTIVSMSLRLFGNMICGTIIMQLVYGFCSWLSTTIVNLITPVSSAFNFVALLLAPVLHAYFDVFSGFIQTLIFIMLTMVFIGNELSDEVKAQD